MTRNFRELLEKKWDEGKFLCVGLDPDLEKIPAFAQRETLEQTIFDFNKEIVEATADRVCAYKPNTAFYEAYGVAGVSALIHTCYLIHKLVPDVPIILDAKRGDIGNTNIGYVRFAFSECVADAITVHPYLGRESLEPFLREKDKGIFVLCRTSNPGAGEFQNFPNKTYEIKCGQMVPFSGTLLYRQLAYSVANFWNGNGNCGLVVGATCPEELREIRERVGNMPILIPGVGAQGGDLNAAVKAGMDDNGRGIIVNSSRGVLYASNGKDFARAARAEVCKLHDAISAARCRGLAERQVGL